MTYHVHAVEQDISGKWYARVCITDEESVFLKFPDFPSMNDIQNAAIAYVDSLTEVVKEEEVPVTMVRARNENGKFIADDPNTPDVDEAWINVPTE